MRARGMRQQLSSSVLIHSLVKMECKYPGIPHFYIFVPLDKLNSICNIIGKHFWTMGGLQSDRPGWTEEATTIRVLPHFP